MEVLPGIFYKTSYGCMCQSYCFFLAVFLFFCLLVKKQYKNRFFDDFEMFIFSFFGKKSRVNNLAMVGSITWPYFGPKFCTEIWPGYWPYFFHTFLVKNIFFKNLILPAERRGFLKNKKTTKNNKKQMARLLTYAGQVIDPTAYMYMQPFSWFFSMYFSLITQLWTIHGKTYERQKVWGFARMHAKTCRSRSELSVKIREDCCLIRARWRHQSCRQIASASLRKAS